MVSDYEHTIRANFRRNFMANVGDAIMWSVGSALVSTATVLPLYLRHLTDSPLIIALVPSIQFIGWRLPQMFMGNIVQRLPRKKPFVIWMSLNERLPFFFLGLFILLAPNASPSIALPVALLLLTWQAFGGGIIANPWQEMIAKVCLPTHWGLFFGVSNALGALLSVGGAVLSRHLLGAYGYPMGFAYSYMLATAFMMLSWASLHLYVEPAKPPTAPATPFRQYLRRLPAIMREDINFRNYILVRSLGIFGSMGSAFLAVHAAERFGLGDEAAATFTAVMMVSMAICTPLAGRIGDKFSHKTVLTALFWAQVGSMVVAAAAPTPEIFLAAFAFKGASEAAGISSGVAIVFEFCTGEERPTYIGLGNTMTAPAVVLAPILAGALASALGYVPVFWISALISVATIWTWRQWVRDPRLSAPTQTLVEEAAPPDLAA